MSFEGEKRAADCLHRSAQHRAFLSSRPADDPNAARELVIGNSMSEIAIDRSDFLSGFGNIDGHAAAGHFSTEEVRMWEAACTAEIEISVDELVVVLKVRKILQSINAVHLPFSTRSHHIAAQRLHQTVINHASIPPALFSSSMLRMLDVPVAVLMKTILHTVGRMWV